MTRFWLAALALLLAASPVTGQGLSRDEVDRISWAVVQVVGLRGESELATGSGTIISPSGRIYTNRHVIEEADDFEIRVLEDLNELPVATYRARLVGYSMDVDFALLQIDRDADGDPVDPDRLNLRYLDVSDPEVGRGDEVFVFGYPGLGEGYLALTEGTVTTIRNGTLDGERVPVWYQTDAQISPGNSGGLVVNRRGEVIGIPTAVRTEGQTGGRLGGVLAIGAVEAAIDQGLETDVGRVDEGTNAPVIAGGRLDFAEVPTFGTGGLNAGFLPDPFEVEVISGGEVAVEYLGGDCAGFAAVSPDYRLNWDGGGSELSVGFRSADGGDATLVINTPDGTWHCDDDSGGGLDPMLALVDPQPGQYDVWVGSYSPGDYIDGTLYFTELGDAMSSAPALTDLSPDSPPNYGTVSLQSGFLPDPHQVQVTSGGSVDISSAGFACVGHVATSPDYLLRWSGRSDELRIFFEAADGGDATLAIQRPDGGWECNDDAPSMTVNPMVQMSNPLEGEYRIWVGAYNLGEADDGTLSITELDRSPE